MTTTTTMSLSDLQHQLACARETNSRLNREKQRLESALAEKMNKHNRQGWSLGRTVLAARVMLLEKGIANLLSETDRHINSHHPDMPAWHVRTRLNAILSPCGRAISESFDKDKQIRHLTAELQRKERKSELRRSSTMSDTFETPIVAAAAVKAGDVYYNTRVIPLRDAQEFEVHLKQFYELMDEPEFSHEDYVSLFRRALTALGDIQPMRDALLKITGMFAGSGTGICEPVEGYAETPHLLPGAVEKLIQYIESQSSTQQEIERLKAELKDSKVRIASLEEAITWASGEAKGRLPEWWHDILKTCDPLNRQLCETKLTIDKLVSALHNLMDAFEVPDSNCACHISPPCQDCVEYGYLRECMKHAHEALVAADKTVMGGNRH